MIKEDIMDSKSDEQVAVNAAVICVFSEVGNSSETHLGKGKRTVELTLRLLLKSRISYKM